MITRADYMDADNLTDGVYDGYKGGETHAAYFSQFVTPSLMAYVVNGIGADALRASIDWHLNGIPLKQWDDMHGAIRLMAEKPLRAAGDNLSLSTTVCVAKQAARMWLAENGGKKAWPIRYRHPGFDRQDWYNRSHAVGDTAEEALQNYKTRNSGIIDAEIYA